tara:strand:- start:94 stop:387 length:294 start_codon:yes stop_codon:yes gene_type:complete
MNKTEKIFQKHKIDKFSKYRIRVNEHYNGLQKVYKFPNGYGASVIRHDGSYGGQRGLWEIAVTLHGILCYDTSITNDVIGHLNTEEVNKELQAIKEL